MVSTMNKPQYDLHIHSNFSDGVPTIPQIVERASEIRLESIAITDHFWPSLGSRRGGIGMIKERRHKIAILREDFPSMRILDGTEVDILSNGGLAPVAGGTEQFDFVIGSVHWLSGPEQWASTMLKTLRIARFDVLGHWDGYLSAYKHEEGLKVANALAEARVAIELSARYEPVHIEFLEAARDAGCLFTLGSDSHSIDAIGKLDDQFKLASALNLPLLDA
ncbi:MAG: PHP domain-containing protein [Candidatus Thorarchaeota archaeon]|nr:PHP domain-containing protein [Candidatus Thorarchaeota archaeon]